MIGANYKRILVGVFGLFILAGIGVQAQEKVNQTDSQGKRHGVWRKNHEGSDLVRYEGQFEHGKEIGEFRFYAKSPKNYLEATRTFNATSDSVMVVYYDSDEKKQSEGYIVGRNREGIWKYFQQDGKTLLSTEEYVQGKLHGRVITYYPNGKITDESTYVNGVLHGTSIKYDEKGNELYRANYLKGEKCNHLLIKK